MLTILGHQFAHNRREFTSTLFTPGATAIGYYQLYDDGTITLYNHQNVPIGGINSNGVLYRLNNSTHPPFNRPFLNTRADIDATYHLENPTHA